METWDELNFCSKCREFWNSRLRPGLCPHCYPEKIDNIDNAIDEVLNGKE